VIKQVKWKCGGNHKTCSEVKLSEVS
jgi:hypothetical protein